MAALRKDIKYFDFVVQGFLRNTCSEFSNNYINKQLHLGCRISIIREEKESEKIYK